MTTDNDIVDPSWLELLKAFELGLIHDGPPPVFEYRLYYDLNGDIRHTTCLTKEAEENNFQLPYIIVNEQEHQQFYKYQVRNGKLQLRQSHTGQLKQLVQSDKGFRVVKNNAAILLEYDEHYPNIEYYDYRNN